MSVLSVSLFLLGLTLVLALVNRRAYRWIVSAFAPPRWVRRTLVGILGFSLAGMTLGRVIDWLSADAPIEWVLIIASTIQLTVFMSVAMLLGVDGIRLGSALVRRLRSKPEAVAPSARVESEVQVDVPAASAAALPRRAFLTQAAVGSAFLVSGTSVLYGTLAGRHDYSVEDFPIHLPGLPRALDGFTIVQLSDIHVGRFVTDAELAAAEELLRHAKADMIVLTGDLLDHDARLAHRLGRFVRRIGPLARHGVVAIPGNHDFYAGIGATVDAVEGGGGRMLRNRGLVIGNASASFALLGVDDVMVRRQGGGPDLERAIASLPPIGGSAAKARDLPRVLLCHNPSFFDEAAPHVGLQLSGHTHGGQVSLVVNPAAWLLKNGWVRGHYQLDGSNLYVNRGFGTVGPPTRIGSPPELTRVVLMA
jgi:uncharacterized protein